MNLKKKELWKNKRKKNKKTNLQNEIVICDGCGRDTRNISMLCDNCEQNDEIETNLLEEPDYDNEDEDTYRETKRHTQDPIKRIIF